MKKGKIVSIIKETQFKKLNEDSFYDGHKFIDYGNNIENIVLLAPSGEGDYSIDKKSLIIKWGVKLTFRNAGIEGAIVNVFDLQANLIVNKEPSPINFGEYEVKVTKEKNIENNDLEMYVTSIEINVEEKQVNVTISI